MCNVRLPLAYSKVNMTYSNRPIFDPVDAKIPRILSIDSLL